VNPKLERGGLKLLNKVHMIFERSIILKTILFIGSTLARKNAKFDRYLSKTQISYYPGTNLFYEKEYISNENSEFKPLRFKLVRLLMATNNLSSSKYSKGSSFCLKKSGAFVIRMLAECSARSGLRPIVGPWI